MPSGAGPHPVVVLVHGGCFKTYGSFADLAAMGDALKGRGIATLNVEYRRVDQAGGGWPNTYLDVGHAVDLAKAWIKRDAADRRPGLREEAVRPQFSRAAWSAESTNAPRSG